MIYVTADIVDFVQNTSLTFTPKANERHIRFVVQADINQIDVDFDAAKMKMILNNLLSNAFHFTPEYGEIIVRILMDTTHQNQVIIEVQDNGIGIPKEYLLSGDYSISETAYKVGYTLPTNFTRTFTKQFGVTPSQYIKEYKK